MIKIAIVTGATGGIGREFVKQLLQEDIDEVWAIARNVQKLDALSVEFKEGVKPISIDLTKDCDIEILSNKLRAENPRVQYLINNAGTAKMAKSTDFSNDEISRGIDLACKVPAILCNMCISYMKKGDRILNISSAASFQPNPYINLYAAFKVFQRSYSRALNMELKNTGITVTAVCPGWVDTDMLKSERNGKKITFPGLVTADQVVKKALKDAKKGKDMSICSLYVKCQHFNVKILPQKVVMKIWLNQINKYLE